MTFAVIAGSVISPLQCRAEGQCPWLNAATAGGVLGGEVQTSVTALTSQGDATCEFKRTQDSVVFTLRIAVQTMTHPLSDFASFLAQCGGTTLPLTAIGNEAVQCVANNGSDDGEEKVIGRVRDRAFVIAVKVNSTKRPATAKGGLSKEARNVAEQVAGALF